MGNILSYFFPEQPQLPAPSSYDAEGAAPHEGVAAPAAALEEKGIEEQLPQTPVPVEKEEDAAEVTEAPAVENIGTICDEGAEVVESAVEPEPEVVAAPVGACAPERFIEAIVEPIFVVVPEPVVEPAVVAEPVFEPAVAPVIVADDSDVDDDIEIIGAIKEDSKPAPPAPVKEDSPAPVKEDSPAPVENGSPEKISSIESLKDFLSKDTPAAPADDVAAPAAAVVAPEVAVAAPEEAVAAPVEAVADSPAPVKEDSLIAAIVNEFSPVTEVIEIIGEVVEDSPAAVKEDSPAFVKEDSPAPVEVDIPAPVKEDSPAPVKEDSPVPVKEDSPAPVKEDSPAPVKEDSPVFVKEDSPAPVKVVIPALVKEDSPVPIKEDSPAPVKEDSPAPVAKDLPMENGSPEKVSSIDSLRDFLSKDKPAAPAAAAAVAASAVAAAGVEGIGSIDDEDELPTKPEDRLAAFN